MASYSINVDNPPFGVSSASLADTAAAVRSAIALLAEGRTVYVSTPDGEILSGDEFVAEVAQGQQS